MIKQTAEQKSLPFTVALTSFGVLEISGPDSDKLLQGQLTIAPSAITPEHLSLGALCNPQGRCIAVFWATRFADKPQALRSQPAGA